MMKVYQEHFSSIEDVEREFAVSLPRDKDFRILLAVYTGDCYEGDAFVLFERDGQLFEVNGCHCSCHGLEDQWLPEETLEEALLHRLTKGFILRDYEPVGLHDWLLDRVKSKG